MHILETESLKLNLRLVEMTSAHLDNSVRLKLVCFYLIFACMKSRMFSLRDIITNSNIFFTKSKT